MKLRTTLFLFVLFTRPFFALAQTSSDVVDFDTYTSATNNDLTNHFNNIGGLYQIPNNGISGGAVKTTSYSSGGSCRYNKLYNMATKATTAMSICFKYDASLYDNTTNDAAAMLTLQFPGPDLGYFILAAGATNISMTTVAYKAEVTVTGGGTLTDGHWYKLQGDITPSPSDSTMLIANMYLYDLGTSGSSSPVLVLSKLNFAMDNSFIYYPADMAEIIMSGGEKGGGIYLDNFNVSGAGTLSVAGTPKLSELSMPSIVNNTLPVSIQSQEACLYSIYSINGTLLNHGSFTGNTNIDIAYFKTGQYIIRFNQGSDGASKRFIKQ